MPKHTREDTLHLQKKLCNELKEVRARKNGLCANRRKVYDSIFKELIVQIKDEDEVLGEILTRIRDEHNMTIDANQILSNKSITYGLQKHIESDDLDEIAQKIDNLENENEILRQCIRNMENEASKREARKIEMFEQNRCSREKEINFLTDLKERLILMHKKIS